MTASWYRSVASLAGVLAMMVSLLAAFCSSVSATPTLITDAYPLAGREPLALAGPATLVAGLEGERADLVRSFAPGRSPSTIARVHPEGEGAGRIDLVGSTSRIGLLELGVRGGYRGDDPTYYQRVSTAMLGDPVAVLATGCPLTPMLDEIVTPEGGFPADTAVALEGEVLAYDSNGCLVIDDFASGLQRIVQLQATLDPVYKGALQELDARSLLQVAGRLVAYRSNQPNGEGPASVVVYDIDTGSELYRVPLPSYVRSRRVPTFALQSDGTLVIANGASCTATVSTSAHPAPVPLGVPACEVDGLRDDRALIVTSGPGKDRTLAWTPIASPSIHPIANLGAYGSLASTIPVMDETSVAYALGGCWMPHVYRALLSEPGVPPTPPTSCPAIVSPRHATLTSRSLRVRIACPLGCHGSFEAYIEPRRESGRHPEVAASRIIEKPPPLSIAPGHPETLTLVPRPEQGANAKSLLRWAAYKLSQGYGLALKLYFSIEHPSTEGERLDPYPGAPFYETRSHIVVPIRPLARQHRADRAPKTSSSVRPLRGLNSSYGPAGQ